ncbi:hypothetical protein MRB53_037271 [Persea americana]|nr:hypothetical protein MRB53_037271 [Persea americana]
MKDMHLNLAFYLPGNIKLPIWVDLRGAVGIMRVRLQLAPDPPFFSVCTLTLLGQPKIELACVPLMKKRFEYHEHTTDQQLCPIIHRCSDGRICCAKVSYLNLRDMITGDDFKKDVVAEGVLIVTVIRGYDFKFGDLGIHIGQRW